MEKKQIRGYCNTAGFSALAYYVIMNMAVMTVMCIDMIIYLAGHLDYLSFDNMTQHLMDFAMQNGWGYLLAAAVGVVIVCIWKGKHYWKETVFVRQKTMTLASFLCIFSVFLTTQAALQVFAPVLEWLLNQVGLSAMAALEAASLTGDTFSMFLYMGFVAPVAEELLFRGLILRTLEPYGKRFAIVMSALLFGLLHGNIVQSPFAFLVGLVLAYVTLEYSVIWAIILHVINNFVLADLLNRLSGLVENLGETIFMVLIIAASIAAVVIMILRRAEVKAYFQENPINRTAVSAFFTAPGVLIFLVLMCFMSLFSITLL